MSLQADVKELVTQAPFVPLVTMGPDGEPHLIVCGRVAEVHDAADTLVFRAVVMRKTRENLTVNPYMQAVLALRGATPKDCSGFRLTGKAHAEGDLVEFRVEQTESLT